jgi:hypothetical protein
MLALLNNNGHSRRFRGHPRLGFCLLFEGADRAAFSAMLSDPEFKKQGAMIEQDMDPLPGDKLQALIGAAQVEAPQLLGKVRRIVTAE